MAKSDPDPNEIKTLEEFEVEYGVMDTKTTAKPQQKLKRKTFLDHMSDPESGIIAIDYKFRRKWLKDNGYDESRQNMSDPSLPPRV